MKILFSILLNASILFIIAFLLNTDLYPDTVVITPEGFDSWKTYLLWWVVLWLLNTFVRPLLKLLWLPLFFIYPIIAFIINAILLWLLSATINNILNSYIEMKFEIHGGMNFLIAVAIFTILNIVYALLFSKK